MKQGATKISGCQGTALKRRCQLSNNSSDLHSFNLPGNWAESLEEKFLHQLVRAVTVICTFVMLLFFLALLMSMVTHPPQWSHKPSNTWDRRKSQLV